MPFLYYFSAFDIKLLEIFSYIYYDCIIFSKIMTEKKNLNL